MGCFLPSVIGKIPGKLHQAAQSNSGRAFGDPGFLLFGPGGAGDIEVQPWRVVDEFFQEDSGGAGAASASASVH